MMWGVERMKSSYPYWYAFLAILFLTPMGIRVLTWPAHRQHAPEPTMVQAGQMLFNHVWVPNDPLCAGGDGLGPVFNANSCVACHHQGGVGGSGGLQHNVTMFVVQDAGPRGTRRTTREGVVHAHAVRYQETLKDVHAALPLVAQPTLAMLVPQQETRGPGQRIIHSNGLLSLPPGVHLSQRNTPALFGAKLIDEIPDRVVIANERSQRLKWGGAASDSESRPVGRALRLADGRVGHFGWKAQSSSLSSFVQAACANELGLSNPGQSQPRPLGKPDYESVRLDLTAQQCDEITAFVASLPRPIERPPADPREQDRVLAGKKLFNSIGCAECHTPDVGSVAGLYSDLLLHRMGGELQGSGSYNRPAPGLPDPSPGDGPLPDEWRTPPLWGVADSGPYLHDGRAATLEQAIDLHAGQSAEAALRFRRLESHQQGLVIAFLKSLRAP
jgi:CxxC motif-containing protein (DUF1111 family)